MGNHVRSFVRSAAELVTARHRLSNLNLEGPARDQLRTMVADVERELTRLPDTNPTGKDLRASWNLLVETLALGESPAMRTCPACKGEGYRAASRCSICWEKLEALPAL